MVRILLHGCCGRMGRMITELAGNDEAAEIVAGVDARGEQYAEYPVYQSLQDVKEDVDAVIDFSNAAAVDALLDWCAEHKVPAAVCTTGLSGEQMEKLKKTSEQVAVLKSANMSIGINLLLNVLKECAPKLAAAGFDCEIVEKHHNQKLDAPSGTAIALADSMNEALDEAYSYKFDRSQERKKRNKYEIGIQAVRGGNIVGEHEVIFAGTDEVITFKHTAYSKAIFGKGAIEAAKYLAGKPAGFYGMADVIKSAS